jgi:hypothetical protein
VRERERDKDSPEVLMYPERRKRVHWKELTWPFQPTLVTYLKNGRNAAQREILSSGRIYAYGA